MERDYLFIHFHFTPYHFNSHAHVERDDDDSRDENSDGNFNSHAHVERDGTGVDTRKTTQTFQLTRSRGA